MSKVWKVALIAKDSRGQQIINTPHVLYNPTPGNPDLGASTVAARMETWIATQWRGMHLPASTCETIVVREEVDERTGDVPEGFDRAVNLAGTLTGSRDGKLDAAHCIHVKASTDVPKRYARGGFYSPPSFASTDLDADGLWLTSTAYWTAVTAFKNALLAGLDEGVLGVTGHFSWVIYSKTQRNRDADNYYFDVKTALLGRPVSYLRSRLSAP